MSRPWDEEKVLKKLDIPDFRHLTKDNVISLASMLDKMDPEVAKKALEQFPSFASESKEILMSFKEILDKALEENAESTKNYYSICDSIIASLQKELDKENLSFDERQIIIQQMLELHEKMGLKDSENKRFLAIMAGFGLAAAALITGILSTVLGGDSKIEFPTIEKK